MRTLLSLGTIAIAIASTPVSAQYYAGQPAYGQQQYAQPTYTVSGEAPPSYPAYAYAEDAYAGPPLPASFDRDEWIGECRRYLRDRRRNAETGGVVGGVLGAAGGAVIGNQIAQEGSKLAGSLIGGGVGGLVGLFIGTAIGLGGRDEEKRDCKAWLSEYERAAAFRAAGGYGSAYGPSRGGSYAYAYANQNAYAQRVIVEQPRERYVAIIREEVVEEYYEAEPETIIRERVIERPAPRKPVPLKPVPIKTQPRIEYVKGQ